MLIAKNGNIIKVNIIKKFKHKYTWRNFVMNFSQICKNG